MLAQAVTVALALVSAAQGLTLKPKSPEITSCMAGTENWLGNYGATVTPWPILINDGKIITIDADIETLRNINPGSTIVLELALKTFLGYVKIACLPLEGSEVDIGSCTYELDYLIGKLAEGGDCALYMPEGQECALPLHPGTYINPTEPISITLPEIPDILVPFLKGTIRAKVHGMDENGQAMFCLQLELALDH